MKCFRSSLKRTRKRIRKRIRRQEKWRKKPGPDPAIFIGRILLINGTRRCANVGEESRRVGFWALAIGEVQDRFGACRLCPLQRRLSLSKHHDRRSALAGCDAEAGGQADGFAGALEGRRKDFHANSFSQNCGVDRAAAWQNRKELMLPFASEGVVAAQQPCRPLD